MRGFRAKDADRDACVELIEAAFVDGQLNSADRDLRVGRALSAETVDELQTLTRDLQLPPGAAVPTTTSAPVQRPRPSIAPRVVGGVLGLFVVGVVLFIGVVAVTMFASLGGESSSDGDSGTIFESELADPEIMFEEQAPAPSFELSAGQVRAFLGAYEDQFGTAEAYEVSFFPDRIQAQVPVRGSRPRMERWTWDGEWRQDTTAAAVNGLNARVDVGGVDVRRMFANIGVAKRGLDVERARFTHAILHRWPDEPTSLNIYVGNQFNESGYLRTTPSGDVVRAYPYDA